MTAVSLDAVKRQQVTCPDCGARQVSAVTSWTQKDQHYVRIEFDCEHGAITRPIKKGKR